MTWRISIDTGGTFTDAFAIAPDGGILLLQSMKGGRQLVLVGRRVGGDGDRQHRFGTLDGRDPHRLALGGEGVTGAGVGQLGRGADVAKAMALPVFGGMRDFEDTFRNRIHRFLEQVGDGVDPDEIDGSGAEGLAAQKVLAAAIRSLDNETVETVE